MFFAEAQRAKASQKMQGGAVFAPPHLIAGYKNTHDKFACYFSFSYLCSKNTKSLLYSKKYRKLWRFDVGPLQVRCKSVVSPFAETTFEGSCDCDIAMTKDNDEPNRDCRTIEGE